MFFWSALYYTCGCPTLCKQCLCDSLIAIMYEYKYAYLGNFMIHRSFNLISIEILSLSLLKVPQLTFPPLNVQFWVLALILVGKESMKFQTTILIVLFSFHNFAVLCLVASVIYRVIRANVFIQNRKMQAWGGMRSAHLHHLSAHVEHNQLYLSEVLRLPLYTLEGCRACLS